MSKKQFQALGDVVKRIWARMDAQGIRLIRIADAQDIVACELADYCARNVNGRSQGFDRTRWDEYIRRTDQQTEQVKERTR